MPRLERVKAELGRQDAHAFKHSADRAAQRFGLKLEVSDYRKAVRAIKTGQIPLELKHRAGETTVTVIVKMKGRPVRAVYDLATERIVTVLPLIPKKQRERVKKW